MAFNTALSGLKAANSDLSVTGNNIANASTTGFKSSRTEFADVYAVSSLGTGSNIIGAGVLISNVAQQFTQGTISFTDRNLDLAINGNGYFVLNDKGNTTYTRSGIFNLDADGYVISNNGSRLQGYGATDSGDIIPGITGDIQIQSTTLAPQQTGEIKQAFNLNSAEEVKLKVGTTAHTSGTGVAVAQVGNNNGYQAGQVTVDGATYNVPSSANLSAAQIAAEASTLPGVIASGITTADIRVTSGLPISGSEMTINGVTIAATTFQEMADYINTNLANVSATVNGTNNGVVVTSTIGQDITVNVNGATTTVEMNGILTQPSTTPNVPTATINLNAGQPTGTIGGEVIFTLDGNTTITGISGNTITPGQLQGISFRRNEFDPTDQNTYNHSTSTTIYDSFGNSHIMTEFFVKEPSSIYGGNTWSMYVQVDGKDVGDPPSANPTSGPTQARFFLRFNEDGTLNPANSDKPVITNWLPADSQGNPNGSLPPITAANGGNVLPLPNPRTSSNFYIDISGSTQYGTDFGVTSLSQDGYSAAQLTRIEVSDTGMVAARFTNGQSKNLGQVVLAEFPADQGLIPLGGTAWGQSFESGSALIGQPQTGNLGVINSGALEDSNVDLSGELVNLILAQRNYQANAKTIETSDAVTQTIINLR